jgi:hypothetical protein
MLAAMLVLEAGTMRGFMQKDERRVRFVWGALTLLVWIAVVGLAWFILVRRSGDGGCRGESCCA